MIMLRFLRGIFTKPLRFVLNNKPKEGVFRMHPDCSVVVKKKTKKVGFFNFHGLELDPWLEKSGT